MSKHSETESFEPQNAGYGPEIAVQLLDCSPEDLDCDENADEDLKKNQRAAGQANFVHFEAFNH